MKLVIDIANKDYYEAEYGGLGIETMREIIVTGTVLKQGKWIEDEFGITICSVCQTSRRDNRINHIRYCNSCGAEMVTNDLKQYSDSNRSRQREGDE